jgi:hypothetical protein
LLSVACPDQPVESGDAQHQLGGRGDRRLWVPETLRASCGLLVFVEEAAEDIVSFDLGDLGRRVVGEWS